MNRLKAIIEEKINELEERTENRHMNDLEYSRYETLNEILEYIEELENE